MDAILYFHCNYFPKFMLNWCQNDHHSPPKSQILIPPTPLTPCAGPPPQLHTFPRPKFIAQPPKTIRKLKPNPKRKTQPSIAQTPKVDRSVQVEIGAPKCQLVDHCTQTQRLTIDLASTKCYQNNLTTARSNSPMHLNSSSYLKISLEKKDDSAEKSMQRSRKPSYDLKIDNNIKTKATHCMAQTRDKVERCDRSKMWGLDGVISQSYHLFQTNANLPYQMQHTLTSYEELCLNPKKGKEEPHRFQQQNTNRSLGDPYTPRVICQQSSLLDPPTYEAKVEEHEQELSPTYPRSTNQLTFLSKYRQIYRNVQSEFKHSQQRSEKRKSQRKLKINHNPRVLFERETIISYSDEHRTASKELMVEESVILERESRSMFTTISEVSHYDSYSMYMAQENSTGILLGVKEVPMSFMGKISQELLIYKEMESIQEKIEGILALYQTQIDFNSYLLIKEPYTHSLRGHLKGEPSLSDITLQLQTALEKMRGYGFRLQEKIKIEDIVVVFGTVKICNLGIFGLKDEDDQVEIEDAVVRLREEMLDALN